MSAVRDVIQVEHHSDPAAFLTRVSDFLLANEVTNALPFGLAQDLAQRQAPWSGDRTTASDPRGVSAAPDHDTAGPHQPNLRCVVRNGRVSGVAIREHHTLPVELSVSADLASALALADDLANLDPPPVGLSGFPPTVEPMARRITAVTGRHVRLTQEFRLMKVTAASIIPRTHRLSLAPGQLRRPGSADRATLVEWFDSYTLAAMPDEYVPGRAEVQADLALAPGAHGGYLWICDGQPVAMAHLGHATPHGERISGVYTPPHHRRHGYASALVAELVRIRLAAGRAFLSLYADTANRAVTRLYGRIGFTDLTTSPQYHFAANQRMLGQRADTIRPGRQRP